MGELGCDSQQQTTSVPQASEPTPGYTLKTDPYRARLAANPTHNIFVKAMPEFFSLPGHKKREQTEKYKLNPDGAKIQTQHHFSFLLQITNNGPRHSRKSTTHRQFDWKCEDSLCLFEAEKKEREQWGWGRWGDQPGEKGDNHQVHSMPICRLVNGLILLECKAAATLTGSLSQQWRANPVTGTP